MQPLLNYSVFISVQFNNTEMKTIKLAAPILIVFFIVSTLGTNLTAQVNFKTLDVSLGLKNNFLKDRSYSPLNFSGNSLQFEVSTQSQNDKRIKKIGLEFGLGSQTYNADFFKSNRYDVSLYYSYNKSIGKFKNWDLFVGPKLHGDLMLTEYDDFESATWLTNIGLDFNLKAQKLIGTKSRIDLEFNYPIIAYVSRPPYAGFDSFISENEDNVPKVLLSKGNITSGFTMIHPSLSFGYRTGLNRKLQLSASYEFEYLHYAPTGDVRNPRPITQINNSLHLGIHFKL